MPVREPRRKSGTSAGSAQPLGVASLVSGQPGDDSRISFFLVKPYIQAIKQNIAREEKDPLKAEMAKDHERALLQIKKLNLQKLYPFHSDGAPLESPPMVNA